jgi:hypothetical protein
VSIFLGVIDANPMSITDRIFSTRCPRRKTSADQEVAAVRGVLGSLLGIQTAQN